MKHPAFGLALLVTFASLGASARTPCQDSSDCQSGQVCAAGQCTAASPVQCHDDFDCKRGQNCSAGLCQAKPPAATAAEQDEAADQNEAPADASPPGTERRNTGLMVGGIVCAGVGGVAVLTGLMMLALAGTDGTQVCSGNDCHPATQSDRDTMQTTGTVAAIVGAGLTVVGIPLIVIGAQKRSGQAPSGTHVAVLPGPTGAALRVRF